MEAFSGENAVVAEGLTKQFGAFTAVDGVSFSVPKGIIFGFLGPNGAGKTTTIRMLLSLLRPTAGSAHVLGFDIVSQTAQIRQRIGYMSQKFSLYEDLSVQQNLNFYGGTYGVSGSRLRQRKEYILHMAGLEGRERELTRNLSGGWKQRLALGAALLHEPQMLFLDEPTAGVDPISRRVFWELLYELAEGGTTILVTTHYMDEAEHCQQIAFIQRGRLVANGSPEAIKVSQMSGQVLEISCDREDLAIPLLRELGVFEEVSLYGNLIHVVSHHPDLDTDRIKETLTVAGIRDVAVNQIAPSLEDVFISTTRRNDERQG